MPYYNDYMSCLENGMGFFHFIVGIVPKEFLWLIEGLGFEGLRHEKVETRD